jgi:hypothetical protein
MHNLQLFFMQSKISLLKTTITKNTIIWLSLFCVYGSLPCWLPFFLFYLNNWHVIYQNSVPFHVHVYTRERNEIELEETINFKNWVL